MAGKGVLEQKPENPELLRVLLRVTGARTVSGMAWDAVIPLGKEHSRSYRRNQTLLLAAVPGRVFGAAGDCS